MSGGQLPADLTRRPGDGRAGTPGGARRHPHQLPSGRHGLLPSFVATNQRERIMAAVSPAVAELGYAEMSVEAIIARAGVSRKAFYQHFKNKEDAFLAAYDTVVRQQARQIRRAYFEETTLRNRLRAGINAYMEFTASQPDVARMCIVEVLAAGPRAMSRRNEAMRMFAAHRGEHPRTASRLPPGSADRGDDRRRPPRDRDEPDHGRPHQRTPRHGR